MAIYATLASHDHFGRHAARLRLNMFNTINELQKKRHDIQSKSSQPVWGRNSGYFIRPDMCK
jgi:hypothetical protein